MVLLLGTVGQRNNEHGLPTFLALHRHGSPVSLRDDVIGQRQTQARATARRSRREERLEDFFLDNAMCQSFFATFECELMDRNRFSSRAEARMAIFSFIEGWYNPHRRHSSLNYQSPITFEQLHKSNNNIPSLKVSTETG